MHPNLQLLERFTDTLASQPVSWFDLPEHTNLIKNSDQHFGLLYSDGNSMPSELSPVQTHALNVLFYPKAKERLLWWLRQIQISLQQGQRLWVVGENNGGIKSLPSKLKEHFKCTKLDSARHCALFELEPLNPISPSNEWQYFKVFEIEVAALPGVFSAKRLDKGTEVLLGVLPELSGEVLEFGAGSGVLTSFIAKQKEVKKTVACDIDLLAVHSSRQTLKLNGLESNVDVVWSDGLAHVPKRAFDALVTNPPFHQGIATSYTASENFFADAKNWLKKDGRLIWVANEFLNYQSIVEQDFRSVNILAHERGFKVFEAKL